MRGLPVSLWLVVVTGALLAGCGGGNGQELGRC